MQVTLNIEASQLGDTVGELFNTLSPEQKAEIARQTLQSWLTDPIRIENMAFDGEAVRRARESWSNRSKSDAELRETNEYREALKSYPTSKELMIKAVRDIVVEEYTKAVKDLVKTDPQIAAMREAVCQVVRETFPRIIHDAMVAFVASNLDRVANTAIQGCFFQLQNPQSGETKTLHGEVHLMSYVDRKLGEAVQSLGLPIPSAGAR